MISGKRHNQIYRPSSRPNEVFLYVQNQRSLATKRLVIYLILVIRYVPCRASAFFICSLLSRLHNWKVWGSTYRICWRKICFLFGWHRRMAPKPLQQRPQYVEQTKARRPIHADPETFHPCCCSSSNDCGYCVLSSLITFYIRYQHGVPISCLTPWQRGGCAVSEELVAYR